MHTCRFSACMKLYSLIAFIGMCGVVLLSGCATFESSRTPGKFVRSTDFSPLDTVSYKHTLISGMSSRHSQESVLQDLSPKVLTEELLARGFEAIESDGDFYVVVKWRKDLSASAGMFDPVDGPTATMARRASAPSTAAVRFTLIVELYASADNELFWRAELPNIFEAIQFSEARVSESLRRAIQNFPERIEKDPTLPNINLGGFTVD